MAGPKYNIHVYTLLIYVFHSLTHISIVFNICTAFTQTKVISKMKPLAGIESKPACR